MFRAWLNRPFPLLQDQKVSLALSFGIGLVSFIILTVFRPWGLDEVSNVTFLLGFGANAALAMVVHLIVLPRLLPSLFNDEDWSIGSQVSMIISILLMISVCNYLYNSTIGQLISPQYSLVYFTYMTTAVGMLPIMIIIYVTELVARKQNLTAAQSVKIASSPNKQQQLTITSDSTNEPPLFINASDLLYAQADGNYTRLVLRRNDELESQYLRLSLKRLQQQLDQETTFVRCHKSYLVNKEHISHMSGNARSMVAHLACVDVGLPVSRSIDLSAFY